MTTWAARITDLRVLGMTYAEIAEATGLAPSTIGDLATGRSKSPRGDSAIKLHNLHVMRTSVARPVDSAKAA